MGLALGAALGALGAIAPAAARAQEAAGAAGTVQGRVTDEGGSPVENAQVYIIELGRDARTGPDGAYRLTRVPPGTRIVRVRAVSYRTQSATVVVSADQTTTQDFRLTRDPLNLSAVVVTGTVVPRSNLESSVALTTLSPQVIEQAAPRSTTEMLRYVPGFTRIESSGGEVNQNISMRGILGVEYVMFMEDGLPVFPTMHTYFMNADNLFRPDENIERVEVVRGGTSALFGSNTPGATINFINKTGGDELNGSMKATGASGGLARYDFNLNGPLGENWRFNLGGFYRYDHGVRDPGFPGVRGGQVKANVTRLLNNGYLRLSVKSINDRNQFILPLPFQNPSDPRYVPGFSAFGSMNTIEGNHVRVPIPSGELDLPLDDGIRTDATWLTADAAFDLSSGWRLQNIAQIMNNAQSWNAILPGDVVRAEDWVGGQTLPAGYTPQLVFTNTRTAAGQRVAFNTPNGLLAPSGEWHVEKPLTAFQDQLQIKRSFGGSFATTVSAGAYFANYTQDNRWFFTDILMDVRDNPRFVDLIGVNASNDTVNITKNGFRNYLSFSRNGSGQATIMSGVLGASTQLTSQLRADYGVRYEWDNFVQSTENTSTVDLDNDPATKYNNETWGNGSFRHFDRTLDDWAGSVGLNYLISDRLSVYAAGNRAYKMPALDDFMGYSTQDQANAVEPQVNTTGEGGVKYVTGPVSLAANVFYTRLKNTGSQGAVTDPNTGLITWITRKAPENRSYGLELETAVTPIRGLNLIGSGTFLKAERATCPDTTGSNGTVEACPPGTSVGSWLNGVPKVIGNIAASYAFSGARLTADWHHVAERLGDAQPNPTTGALVRTNLPAYNYMNFGLSYLLPGQQVSLNADLLNAFQSKGLEEGNPRLSLIGGRTSDLFLARPILPRRFMASLRYAF